MTDDTLRDFARRTHELFGPLSIDVALGVGAELETLVRTSPDAPWLARLYAEAPASEELMRDATHGYRLLVHTEPEGLYRPPHDHGRGWVVYALSRGEMRISTYARVEDDAGQVRLVKRGSEVLRPGEARVYWPGDIHDTRCTAGPALLFRFTDRDLRREDLEAHRVTRYPAPEAFCTRRAS